ncbi:mevalonate kinase family protein [Galenea microaerophila]
MTALHCTAPAKLLITGEHAVLNGIPALSLAINLHSHTQLQHQPQTPDSLLIELKDFQQLYEFPFPLWEKLAIEAEARYQNFLNHHLPIQAVLKTPVDLVLLLFYHFHQHHPLKKGCWKLSLNSEIWQGRGLGSSASIIVSLLSALNEAHGKPLSLVNLKQLAQTIESRQHGHASGVDTTTVILGGLIQYQWVDGVAQIETLPQRPLQGYLIDTGKPKSTTGECVEHVRQHFPQTDPIWQQFRAVSEKMIQAWLASSSKQLKNQIRENQALLERIGVVPSRVAHFIETLHQDEHTAAKVCGAGSLKGEHAGVVLCLAPEPPKALCEHYGYRWQKIKIAPQGAQCESI